MTTEKLTNTERNQISKWIGQSVNYRLLYKATRDGMSPVIFHEKCDNKGPTVIVCWNTDDCVFGGYTSCNWFGDSTARYFYDSRAFLFLLKSMGKNKPTLFDVKNPAAALYYSNITGPVFGHGPDLQIFNNEVVSAVDGVFKNELAPVFGSSYQGGLTMAEISNNNFNYSDVEAYQLTDPVLLTNPWRTDNQRKSALRSLIEAYEPVDNSGVDKAQILLVGSVGAGKSSFVNTINSTFRGYVTSQAGTGSAEHSLTTAYRKYQIRNGTAFLNCRLCDTRGMEDTQSINPGDIVAMLDGHLPELYSFNPVASITPLSPGYNKSPSLKDKIHCIAFVIDSTSVEVMSESVLSKFKEIQDIVNQRGIALPMVILLTKVDQLSMEVEEDVNKLLYCSRVAGVVDTVSQLIGLPRGHVLPVKNYEKETELNDVVDRFALLALQQMLRFADDYMYNILDTQSF